MICSSRPDLTVIEDHLFGRGQNDASVMYDTGVSQHGLVGGYKHQSPSVSAAYNAIDTRAPLWLVITTYTRAFDDTGALVSVPGIPYVLFSPGPHATL
jgi:hypothetical protein